MSYLKKTLPLSQTSSNYPPSSPKSKPRKIIPQILLFLHRQTKPPIPQPFIPLPILDLDPNEKDATHEPTLQQQRKRNVITQRITGRLRIEIDIRRDEFIDILKVVLKCQRRSAFVVSSHCE